MKINGKIIHVSVAVLRFFDEFLLAIRHGHQHQGGKLEFVGGKIEWGETPESALIREVKEELGLDVADNIMTKLGRICHDYGDKIVQLYVYQVWLNNRQYLDFKDKNIGLDGQAIGFYGKDVLLGQKNNFPVANQMILTWLTLPSVIAISHQLSHFSHTDDWLNHYQNLAQGGTLLIRTQADTDTNTQLIRALSTQREDLCFILSLQDVKYAHTSKALAVRLTQNELLDLDLSMPNLPNLPIIVSCHDMASLHKVNALAKIHPVMAVLLSPVLPTKTHPDRPCLGWVRFNELSEMSDVPVIALGGLSPSDLSQAWAFGAVAVAGIRAFV